MYSHRVLKNTAYSTIFIWLSFMVSIKTTSVTNVDQYSVVNTSEANEWASNASTVSYNDSTWSMRDDTPYNDSGNVTAVMSNITSTISIVTASPTKHHTYIEVVTGVEDWSQLW